MIATKQITKKTDIYFVLVLTLVVVSYQFVLGDWAAFSKMYLSSQSILIGDQMQNLAPLFSYYDPHLFLNYVYFDAAKEIVMPLGYKLFYFVTSQILPPWVIGTHLTPILTGITFIFCLLSLNNFCSKSTIAVAAFFLISSICITDSQLGGLQRAFAYPIIALSYYAALKSNFAILVISYLMAVLFYPQVAPVVGCITLFFLIFSSFICEHSPSASKKIKYILILAVISLLVVPMSVAKFEYGGGFYSARKPEPFIAPYVNFVKYYFNFGCVNTASINFKERYYISVFRFDYLCYFTLAASVFVLTFNFKKDIYARRIILLLAGAFISYLIVYYSRPYLYAPDRLARYSLTILCFVIIFYSLSKLGRYQIIPMLILSLLVFNKIYNNPAFNLNSTNDHSTLVGLIRSVPREAEVLIPYRQNALSARIIISGRRKVYVGMSLNSLIGNVALRLKPMIRGRIKIQEDFFEKHNAKVKTKLCTKENVRYAIFDEGLFLRGRSQEFLSRFKSFIERYPKEIAVENSTRYVKLKLCNY